MKPREGRSKKREGNLICRDPWPFRLELRSLARWCLQHAWAVTEATAGFLARIKLRRRKTTRTQTQKRNTKGKGVKSMKCKMKKGNETRTDERSKFNGVQRGPSKGEHQLRTSLRELIGDVLLKGYEKGWGKGRASSFVAG